MNKIKKINQYLLERYPTVWNTKLVLILGVSLSIHLVFFILGFFSITNVEKLHSYNVEDIFFDNGMVFFNVIISLLILVFWLISMFKNNAFQNFYPYKPKQLFGQFIQYVIIIVASTTFFISYQFGLRAYANITYPDEVLYDEIKKTNEASIFFSNSLYKYTIDQKSYPAPFNELICETSSNSFKKGPKYEWLNLQYQFYKNEKDLETSRKARQVYGVIRNPFASGYTSFKQDTELGGYVSFQNENKYVPNLADYAIDLEPSYFNFSEMFYVSRKEKLKMSSSSNYSNYLSYEKEKGERIPLNTFVYNLLKDPNSKDKIKIILDDFMSIADKYHIKKNLTTDVWLELILADKKHPFRIANFIRKEEKRGYVVPPSELTASELFVRERTTSFYLESSDMQTVFDNIEDLRFNNQFFISFHFFIWFAIGLAILIILFRTSGLRNLLFSIISGAIISISVGLFIAFLYYVFNAREEYLAYFILLALAIIILIAPSYLMKRNYKKIATIAINISLIAFPFLILLIASLISEIQKDHFDYEYSYTLVRRLGFLLSPIIMIFTIIFVYLRCFTIKKWKGLPEG